MRLSLTIGTFSGPLGFLRFDSICGELHILSCMTYRLSIPTPREGGIKSHHHCGSISLQRLDSDFTSLHMINCDNETGNWYELYYQRFLICLLIRELEQQQRITGDEILGDRALYFFVLQYLISLHVFDDDAVTSVTVSLANH